ncbi:MAG: SusD/RagB family nutrient-binding outer membrane lipoprotein [Saprospiraceae bacterium]|nr:SusD/RagB family nutrient-binding outer membrane lipoprotein [Saprospiraceae bacterium]
MLYISVDDGCFWSRSYQEALKGDKNKTPAYASQREIYFGILDELHQAILDMDESAGSYGGADIIYSGDVSKWKKFAHSLILRISMRMSDVEPEKAKLEFEKAFAQGFLNNLDHACFKYLSTFPNNNPLHQQRIERGDADLGLSDILIDKTLKPLNDPRLAVWGDVRTNGVVISEGPMDKLATMLQFLQTITPSPAALL